jgi:hypothetical protein
MTSTVVARKQRSLSTLGLLALLIWCSATALAQDAAQPMNSPLTIAATHLLGFEGAKSGAKGTLTIQDNAVQFQKNGTTAGQVEIASLRHIYLGGQSKQVGGVPMTLGKAATPFGGGRVVSLFAHKKYDTFAVEYIDANQGVHGAIFQLSKGQGAILRNELVARGAHVSDGEEQPAQQTNVEVSSESK